MRRALLILPLLIFLVLAGFFLSSLMSKEAGVTELELPSPLLDKLFPSFDLPSVLDDQTRITQADLKGPALVNVWATWCVACKVEHPVLNRLASQGVVIYGVNYKDQADAARRFLGRYGDPFTAVGIDPLGRGAIEWGVYGMPETFVIAPDGTIAYKHVGPITETSLQNEVIPAIEAARKTVPGS